MEDAAAHPQRQARPQGAAGARGGDAEERESDRAAHAAGEGAGRDPGRRCSASPRSGANDNFFDLGGHSLAATRVVTQIRGRLPAGDPAARLFEAPTLAELAARLEEMGRRAGVDMAEMAEVILEVQELEEGEVEALLAEETVK